MPKLQAALFVLTAIMTGEGLTAIILGLPAFGKILADHWYPSSPKELI